MGGILLICIVLSTGVRPPWRKTRLTTCRHNKETAGRGHAATVERGELKLVMFGSSPQRWWGEVYPGLALNSKVLKQVGFGIVAVYAG